MKIIKQSDSEFYYLNGENVGWEYDFHDREIDFCITKLKGRCPEKRFSRNVGFKELCFCMDGSGVHGDKNFTFKRGDCFLIEKNERYFLDGDCTLGICCTPAFSAEEHIIED